MTHGHLTPLKPLSYSGGYVSTYINYGQCVFKSRRKVFVIAAKLISELIILMANISALQTLKFTQKLGRETAILILSGQQLDGWLTPRWFWWQIGWMALMKKFFDWSGLMVVKLTKWKDNTDNLWVLNVFNGVSCVTRKFLKLKIFGTRFFAQTVLTNDSNRLWKKRVSNFYNASSAFSQ